MNTTMNGTNIIRQTHLNQPVILQSIHVDIKNCLFQLKCPDQRKCYFAVQNFLFIFFFSIFKSFWLHEINTNILNSYKENEK